jgi:predicted  nucleic acid-binding Zn-ribbon protein
MHPDLEKLILLQAQDIEAKRLRDEIAALPKLVANLEMKAAAAVGQRAVILDLIAKEETLRRRQESDIKDLQQKIARTRTKIDAATTTHMVTALEHELAFAKSEISRIEDGELESMERTEALESQRTLANQAVADSAAILERERLRAAETVDGDKLSLAAVDQVRTTMRAAIAEDALSTYDRIARGKGTAISEALNQKCTACQMMVRPQRWNDLRDNAAGSTSSQTMMTCENCGRLLYYDPARDTPQRKPVQTESIAAQIVRSL